MCACGCVKEFVCISTSQYIDLGERDGERKGERERERETERGRERERERERESIYPFHGGTM